MQESCVCKTVFITLGFDYDKNFLIVFNKNIFINICLIKVFRVNDFSNITRPSASAAKLLNISTPFAMITFSVNEIQAT
jgi:hypothetical protein